MSWYSQYLTVYNKEYIPNPDVLISIKKRFSKLQSDKPIATICIIAYNEEKHLLSCLWSLSNIQTKYPIEIIGVDNNSSDKTSQIFKDCGIKYYIEKKRSCGYARLCGLSHAKGRFHINIDGDTMYPKRYAEFMINNLIINNYVGVYSTWSYCPDKDHSRLGLFFYENIRNIYLWIQSFKRPELSVRGLAFAYNTELAKKVGIRTNIIRGEDGSLALSLKKYGKLRFIYNFRNRPVTGCTSLSKDGSLLNSFKLRLIKGFKYIPHLLYSKDKYDDKDSNLIK